MNEKIVGILGGMGPEATWDLFGRIIKRTPVKKDADHLRVIIDSNPKIPDRTAAILSNGPSPVDAMIQTGLNLENSGADFLVIPCMTAHYFYEAVQTRLKIPIINAFELMKKHIEQHFSNQVKVLVVATSGSIQSGLYQKYLPSDYLVFPGESIQEEEVMDLIYGPRGIKAGYTDEKNMDRLYRLMQRYQQSGVSSVIAGCTEIGLLLKDQATPLPVIDPLDLLAHETLRLAKEL
ncbi:aspartate racemase [Tindallia magadiensis]|uniref:Aspartate racemase n=1 Tax=Tindallia magadiensis TaxID=69895 RepID=A0A1I3BC30_9FIRM|nr:amino acid racemase [Tindallia magadiensis]SFH59700.1 aspartate racemase [Tindallia magadiensis]